MASCPSFSWLSSLLYICTMSSSSIPRSVNTWVVPWLGHCKYCCCERWGHAFLPVMVVSRYLPGGWGIAGALFIVFLRNIRTVLHSSCSNLHPNQRVEGLPFLHSLYSICYFCRLFSNSHSDRCMVIAVWICISLIISDVEHLFMCPLAICM